MERVEKLKSFIAADPQDYFSRHALAMEFIKSGNADDAIELLEAILRENPGYIGSYLHLGRLFEKKGLAEKAAEVYELGITQASILKDFHARGELQTALDLME